MRRDGLRDQLRASYTARGITAMASQRKTGATDLIAQTRGILVANPVVAPQVEQFWKAQGGILEEAEAYSNAWFQRRREAARTALEAVRKASSNHMDSANALSAMTDWQQHSFQRLMQDAQGWLDLWTRCANRMADAKMSAGLEGLEEVEKRTRPASRTRQTTPV
jgi:hypothetical protein